MEGNSPRRHLSGTWSSGSSHPASRQRGRSRWRVRAQALLDGFSCTATTAEYQQRVFPSQQVYRSPAVCLIPMHVCRSHVSSPLRAAAARTQAEQQNAPTEAPPPTRAPLRLSPTQWGRKDSLPVEMGRGENLINDECDLTDQGLYTFS